MAGHPKARRAAKDVLRGVLFLVLLLLACIATMTISFLLVRHLGRGSNPSGAEPAPAMVREVTRLHGWADELLAITAEYLDHLEHQSDELSQPFHVWLKQDLSPRLNDLRRRMLAAPGTPQGLSALLSAAGQVASMVAVPEDEALREVAVAAVLDATAGVEARAKTLGVWGDLERRRRSGHFHPHEGEKASASRAR